jgi:hypothetical protein
MGRRKKYAVGFAICSCHLIIRSDKSRKVGQIEDEGNPKERNSCRDIATEETMFIYFIYLFVGHLEWLSGDENVHSGEWIEY